MSAPGLRLPCAAIHGGGVAYQRCLHPSGRVARILHPLDFDETLDALASLEDAPVALDSLIMRSADGLEPGDCNSTSYGYLKVHRPEPASERPIDEAAWLVGQRERRRIFRIDHGSGGIIMAPERFRKADWDGSSLMIEIGAIAHSIVRLVRPGGESPDVAGI